MSDKETFTRRELPQKIGTDWYHGKGAVMGAIYAAGSAIITPLVVKGYENENVSLQEAAKFESAVVGNIVALTTLISILGITRSDRSEPFSRKEFLNRAKKGSKAGLIYSALGGVGGTVAYKSNEHLDRIPFK